MKKKKVLLLGFIAIIVVCVCYLVVVLKRHSGEFTECSARLNSETRIEEQDDARTAERYTAINFVACKCVVMYINNKMYTTDKEKVFQYSSVQSKEELDCNNKCIEICR